jgi:Ribbon-helix-helix protein, copG family
MPKIRVVIYLEASQIAALQRLKAKTGASIAELCRRAIADWTKKQG